MKTFTQFIIESDWSNFGSVGASQHTGHRGKAKKTIKKTMYGDKPKSHETKKKIDAMLHQRELDKLSKGLDL